MAAILDSTCEFLLQRIRASGLNYSCQETPYSIYVTLRKSFAKSRSSFHDLNHLQETNNQELELAKIKRKYEILLANHKNLEKSFDHLKLEHESAIEENLSNYKLLENLESVIQKKSDEVESLDSTIVKLQHNEELLKCALNSKQSPISASVSTQTSSTLEMSSSHASSSALDSVSSNPSKLSASSLSTLTPLLTGISSSMACFDSNQNISNLTVSTSAPSQITCPPTVPAARDPPRTSPGVPAPGSPPPQDLTQLNISFRNFLDDFKSEDGDLKYLKQAKEMVSFQGNVLHIDMKDMHKHNQFLSERVRNDYHGVFSSFTSGLRTFLAENIDGTRGKEYYLSFSGHPTIHD
jgi:hypothetical protein